MPATALSGQSVSTPRPLNSLFVAVVCLCVQGRMVLRNFLWDDVISRQQMAMQGRWRLFSPDAFGFIRPGKVALLSLLDQIFGNHAIGWELVLLAVLVVLVLLVLRFASLFLDAKGALVAAVWYAVHPLHVEAAGWISAANGTIASIFAVLYLSSFARRVECDARQILQTSCLLALAVLFKEDSAILPVLGAIVVVAKHGTVKRTTLLVYATQCAAALLYVVAMRHAAGGAGQLLEVLPLSRPMIAASAPLIIFAHLVYALMPFYWAYENVLDYTSPVYTTLIVVAWICVCGCAYLFSKRWRSLSVERFGVVFAAVAFLPVSNLIPLGNAHWGVRYLSLPAVGLALMIGSLASRSLNGRASKPVAAAAIVLMGIMAVCTIRWHGEWSSEERFFKRMTAENPKWYFPLSLAKIKMMRADLSAAETLAKNAVLLSPDRPEAQTTLGLIHAQQGYPDAAAREWEIVLVRHPENIDANAQLGDYWDKKYQVSRNVADRERADNNYSVASRGTEPNSEISVLNRGLLWAIDGDTARALTIWQDGLAKFPASAALRQNIAIAQRKKTRNGE